MSDSYNFDKFVKDLENRNQRKLNSRKISQEERDLAERRRLRVRLYQELWQNRVVSRKRNEPKK